MCKSLSSYRKLCSAFKSQLQENKLLLESFIPDPVSILALQNQKKHLQASLSTYFYQNSHFKVLLLHMCSLLCLNCGLLHTRMFSQLLSMNLFVSSNFWLKILLLWLFHKHVSPQQTLKKETEALWFDVELQYTQFSQFAQPMTREEGWSEVEREQGYLNQQWREQQVCLQTRCSYPLK